MKCIYALSLLVTLHVATAKFRKYAIAVILMIRIRAPNGNVLFGPCNC